MPSYTWRCFHAFWSNSLNRLDSTELETKLLVFEEYHLHVGSREMFFFSIHLPII